MKKLYTSFVHCTKRHDVDQCIVKCENPKNDGILGLLPGHQVQVEHSDRWTDRPTDQLTDRSTDRLTNRPIDRPTDLLTDRSTDRPTNRPTSPQSAGGTEYATLVMKYATIFRQICFADNSIVDISFAVCKCACVCVCVCVCVCFTICKSPISGKGDR